MRFLIDENLPLALARWLAEQGHDALHTSAIGLNSAPDLDLVREAARLDAVIVTKDNDFLTLSTGAAGPRVVHMRVGNRPSRQLIALCERVWPQVIAALEGGERVVQVGGLS